MSGTSGCRRSTVDWIMLRSPLRADESLAISYVTERGDTIGTINPEKAGSASAPLLKLLRGPGAEDLYHVI